ncbi:MAG: hypothetical protein KJZ59_00205, partial [Pararhodobacter sp.]|nr:hypothetical protein [Pararhodobacter sp.]
MTEPESMARRQGPGILVHVGAGEGLDLDRHIGTGCSPIILIEPNPACFPGLEALALATPGVQIWRKAIAEGAGNQGLNLLSMARFSTLRDWAGLKTLFPGIALDERLEVETMTPAEMVAALPDLAAKEAAHRLVVQATGVEAEILAGLEACGALARFASVEVSCGAEPLFDGALAAPDLTRWMADRFFNLVSRDDHDDPDWPVLVFEADPDARALSEAQEELTRLRDRLDRLSAQNTALNDGMDRAAQAHLAALAKARDEATAREAEQAALLASLRKDLAAARSARDKLKDEFAAARDAEQAEAARRAAQSDAEQAKAAARLQEVQGKLDAALADRAALAKAHDAAHDEATAREAEQAALLASLRK